MKQTHELIRALMPTSESKTIIGKRLSKSRSQLYKWEADPMATKSSASNPLDVIETILEHARVHHPAAAIEVEEWVREGNRIAIARAVRPLPLAHLLTEHASHTEMEIYEALTAVNNITRRLLVNEAPNLDAAIKELQEARTAMDHLQRMLEAAQTGTAVPESLEEGQ